MVKDTYTDGLISFRKIILPVITLKDCWVLVKINFSS